MKQNEFLVIGPSIDNEDMITSGNAINAWLISSPSSSATTITTATTICRMDLSKPLPPTPQEFNARRTTEVSKTYQTPSLEHRTSDISNPGLMEDMGSSGSEISLEDCNHDSSLEIGTEIWDSYWSPKIEFSTPSYLPKRPPLRNQFSNLSYDNRNFATSDLSALKSPTTPQKSPRRPDTPNLRHVSQPKASSPHVNPSFLAAPPTPPPHGPHHSWPRRVESRQNRPRAQTTPSQFQARPPSNLSTCTTLDNQSPVSSGQGTPLYMVSPPPTPLFGPPFIDLPPITCVQTQFAEEVSQFEEDDDDDEDSPSMRLRKMLHIRSGSSNQGDSTLEKDHSDRLRRKSLRKLRKSLSDVASDANETFKGVFRKK